MFNDIVKWLKSIGVCWATQLDANSPGKEFIKALRDALWYVDGHWNTLRDQGCEIPETLRRQFPEGYNTPEKWKGRKKVKRQ